MKKILLIFLFFLNIYPATAYDSSDWVNLYYEQSDLWTKIYDVPEGKDLIINLIYTDNPGSSHEEISDNYTVLDNNVLFGSQLSENYNNINIVITESLWVRSEYVGEGHELLITGMLVIEGQNINNIIDKKEDGINKPVFTKEAVDEIYMIEGVAMIIIVLITFFLRILGIKKKGSLFFWR